MMIFKNIISLTTIIILILSIFAIDKSLCNENVNSFRLITLLAAHTQDLGFNNMVNQGHIGVSKEMKLDNARTYIVSGYNDTIKVLAPLVAEGDVSFVICSSQDHTLACRELATKYLGTEVKTQFLIRGSGATTANLITYSYNYANSNYVSGYFAGLITQTNKIGFLSPGFDIANNNDSFVYAFWRGAKDANENIEFYYYNIGAYLNPDKTTRAAQKLIDMGCDIIGDTLNDFSTGETMIFNGKKAIGTNGFPQRTVYGEDVIYSYAYNWTKLFLPIALSVQSGNTNNTVWYGDFNTDPDLNFFSLSFSYTVPQEVLDKFNAKLDTLKLTPRLSHPYFCNDLVAEYAAEYGLQVSATNPNCFVNAVFTRINKPFRGMTYLGNYEIILQEIYFNPVIQRSFSAVGGILIAIVLAMICGILKFSDTPSIRSASPFFLNIILFGATIVYVGIIIWVGPVSTHSCNARFWLVTIGFTVFIGSLVVKNFRIWLIFDNPLLKQVKITNYQLLPWVGGCLLINIVLMSILTTVGDLKEIEAQGFDELGSYEFMRICKMNSQGAYTLYTILAYFAALLLVGVFVSWKIRIVDIQEFNESRAIANTLYAISFCLFVIVPLMISPQSKQSEMIVICTAALFIVTSAVMIIYIPKFYRVYLHGFGGTNEMFNNRKKQSPVATARAESTSKGSSGGRNSSGLTKTSGTKTNRRGNIISGDFSDDSESTITEPKNNNRADVGAVLAEFTDDTISDTNDNMDDNDNQTEQTEQIEQSQQTEQIEQNEQV